VWTPRGHPEADQGLETTSKTLWAAEAIPPKKSLTEGQTAGTEGRLTLADGVVAGGWARPLGSSVWALVVLSRSRLTPEVTGLSKLGGIARMETPAKILA